MKNYYLHRISHQMEWSHPLLEQKQLLSIGWSEYGARPNFVSEHQDDWPKVADTLGSDEWGRSRFSLQRFLEMEQGDWVVVPTYGKFHVLEIADAERLVPSQIENELKDLKSWDDNCAVIRDGCMKTPHEDGSIDLGFFRRVEKVELDIPREGYADAALTSRMKVRQTNVNIDDLRKSIEGAIDRHRQEKPIDLRHEILAKCQAETLKAIRDLQNPNQFEKLIKRYFEYQGASAEIPAKNERDKKGDADIVATFESLKVVIYVQAKLHHGVTDDLPVKQIVDYADNKRSGTDEEYTQLTWVVSAAEEFSKTCCDHAIQKRVRLIDGKEFARMILDSGIEWCRDWAET